MAHNITAGRYEDPEGDFAGVTVLINGAGELMVTRDDGVASTVTDVTESVATGFLVRVAPAPALISTDANTGARTYIGPAIHDGSPAEHVTAALSAAQDHSVPAVREYLTRALTTQLARTTPSARTR